MPSSETRSVFRVALLALLVVSTALGGCLARPGGVGDTATTATETAPETTTSPVHPPFGAERAITAERERIEELNASQSQIEILTVDTTSDAEWELLERRVSGILLRVELSYRVELDCVNSTTDSTETATEAGTGTETKRVTEAKTITRYFVTDDEVTLESVEKELLDPTAYCGESE